MTAIANRRLVLELRSVEEESMDDYSTEASGIRDRRR